ncbi:hypothetical protein ACI3PL_28320, partial [Lacticaseibacillus paracasei]
PVAAPAAPVTPVAAATSTSENCMSHTQTPAAPAPGAALDADAIHEILANPPMKSTLVETVRVVARTNK